MPTEQSTKSFSSNIPLHLRLSSEINDDTKLWRYMDLAKFISMLHTQTLWFARSDTFKDKHEGKFHPDMRKALDEIYSNLDKNHDDKINNAKDFQEFLTHNAFISCWHKNIDENMVMWEIYSQNSNAVAIQTTASKLKNNLIATRDIAIDFHGGEVRYELHENIKGPGSYSWPFFIKRPHFSFEQEVRLLLCTWSAHNVGIDRPAGIPIHFDLKQCIEKILVHPDSDSWFIESIKAVLEKFQINIPVAKGAYGNK